ncbi:hypothetical protein GCM10027449_18850 [Sinomonas notoginsengisoli]|uniref:hypothetical protein n=1 Tax=Sinomonas notoginsengisoli TaxID=1457311 RepID=UPI001F44B2F5|nr:hypothetical protein [Sinomonas notoginsengisoli]
MSGLNLLGEPEPYPVVVPAETLNALRTVRSRHAPPVWVRLTFDDERPDRIEKGFAQAWTGAHVLVQVLWSLSYYRGAREFWVEAHQVRRRTVGPQWHGRPA